MVSRRMILVLWASGLTMGAHAGDGKQPPDPPSLAYLAPGCMGPVKASDGIEYLDYGKAHGGDLFLVKGRDLWLWKQTDRGHRFLSRQDVPTPPRSGFQYFEVPKWRAGSFWFPAGQTSVQRYDALARRWETILTRPSRFEDLEVTPAGQMVLIGTASHLAEIWEPGATAPLRSIPYPKLDLEGLDRALERQLWTQIRTAVCDEFILVYAGVLGRAYRLDTTTFTLRELAVPWIPLDLKHLGARISRQGGLVMTGYPPVGCLQFIPDLGLQVRVVFHVPDVEVVAPKPGRRLGPMQSIPEFHWKSDDESLRTFSWSLFDGTKDEVQRASSMAFPVWLNSSGDLVPLDPLLEKHREPSPKGSSRGEKSGPGKPAR